MRAPGRLAQLVEHIVYTDGVGGSNPSPPTSLRSASEQGCRAEAQRAKAGSCTRELGLGKLARDAALESKGEGRCSREHEFGAPLPKDARKPHLVLRKLRTE